MQVTLLKSVRFIMPIIVKSADLTMILFSCLGLITTGKFNNE